MKKSEAQPGYAGGCLCGQVRFDVAGPLGDVSACHCHMCRKWTGHYFADTEVPVSQLSFSADESLKWYQSSEKVRRGFCGNCGSVLFFDPLFHDWIAITMGSFDEPTGAKLALHIHTADKGDYYNIADGLPQNEQ